jgi:hypothetical protein
MSDILRPAGYRRQEATGKARLCGNAAQATLEKDGSEVHGPLTRHASAVSCGAKNKIGRICFLLYSRRNNRKICNLKWSFELRGCADLFPKPASEFFLFQDILFEIVFSSRRVRWR